MANPDTSRVCTKTNNRNTYWFAFNGKEMRMDLTHKLGEAGEQALEVKLPEDVVKNSATASIESHDDKSEPEEAHAKDDESSDDLDWLNVGGVFIGVNIIVIGLIVAW